MLQKPHAKIARCLPKGEDGVMLVSALLMLVVYTQILLRFAGA